MRTADPSDAPAVAALLERAYPTLMAATYDTDALAVALPATTKANPALLASEIYYVIVDGWQLVGCGGWTTEKPGSREVEQGIAHLRHFATDPDQARQGISRTIYDRCVAEALDRGRDQSNRVDKTIVLGAACKLQTWLGRNQSG